MGGVLLSLRLAPVLAGSTEVGETAALSFDSPLPTPVPFATPAISRYGEIALQHIAEQKGVSTDALLIEQEHPRSYPLLGREFMAFTILDTKDGQAYVLLVDVDSGAVEDDLSALEQANAEAHLARYGKLDPALYERLQSGDDAATLPVALWVVSDYDDIRAKLESELAGQYPEVAEALSRNVSPFDVADPAQAEELRKVWAEMLQRELDGALAPLMSALEAEHVAFEKQNHLPALTAKLTKTQILELAKRDDVQLLYLVEGVGQPTLDTAVPADRAPAVWSSGVNGAGRTIAVVENGNVDHDNIYLNVSATQRAGCSGENNHATQVASAAASTHGTHRGVAFGATILSAGVNPCTEPYIYDALSWALDNGAHVINVSYGVDLNTPALQWNDVAFDYAARSRAATIVVAAGNWRNRHIYSPGKAWNVITVGGTNNQDTAAWHDDQMYEGPDANEGSAYEDPGGGSGGDREKPEVVAPAQWITAIGPDNVFLAPTRGTSYAAPQVSGLAALLMQRNGQVYNYPLAVKSIIMATAVHNIEGARRLSDEDGAGAIDAALADAVVQTRADDGVQCTKPCWWAFDTTSGNPGVGVDKVETFTAVRGENIRVAISWWSAVGAPLPWPGIGIDTLATNFDLRVYRPGDNSTPVASSTSVDNNFELVEFTAPETGVYSIRVRKQSASESNNSLGIAWSKQASYLPDVRSGGGWENTLYVRNSDPTVRPAQVAFSKDNGDALGYLTNPTLAGGALWQASAAFYTTPASAVVDGSEELLAVVRNRSVASNLIRLDNGFRSGAGDPAFEQAATTLYIPVFYRAIYGNTNSTIDVFHPSAQGTYVTFEFRGRSGYGDHTTGSYWVPAGGRLRIEATAVPFSPWVGSVRILAGQPVAATVSERNAVFERSFNAAAAGHRLQYVPAAYKNAWNLTTGLLVQNVGSSTVNVTFTFCERLVTNPNTCPTYTHNNLAPLRAIGLNLENVGALTSGWSGSVKITSSDNATPLVTVVNNGLKDASGALVDGYNFNASNYGGRWVYLPYAARNADGRSTGFTLRNVSGGNISGNAHYYDQDGTLRVSYPFTLASAQVMGRAQVNDALPDGWVGSILLEASGPILAILREDAPNRSAGYNGLVLAP
jgi:hypothetical protein